MPVKKGFKMSAEAKKAHSVAAKKSGCGLWMKGRKLSQETIEKLRTSHLGQRHPNSLKNLSRPGRIVSEETRKKLSESAKGRTPWNKGLTGVVIHSIESRKKASDSHKARRHLSHLWKGGIHPVNKAIRKSLEYRLWREAVFKRDDWTCMICFIRGGDLEADHIKAFSLFPELRLEVRNGRTLCRKCHKKTDNYGYKANVIMIETEMIKSQITGE